MGQVNPLIMQSGDHFVGTTWYGHDDVDLEPFASK